MIIKLAIYLAGFLLVSEGVSVETTETFLDQHAICHDSISYL